MTNMMKLTDALRSRAEYLKANAPQIFASGDTLKQDGDMMYSAAVYIERLERDKSQLVEQVASYARAYDKAELVLAHMDRQKTELNKTVIERDAAIEQIDGLQRDKTALVNDLAHARNERLRLERTTREQRDAYSRSLDAEVRMRNNARAERDSFRAERDKLVEGIDRLYKQYLGPVQAPVQGPVFEQVKAQILDEVKSLLHSCGVFAPSDIPATPRYFVTGMGPSWFVRDRSQPLPNKFNIERCQSVGKFDNLGMAKRFAACLNTLVPNTKL